MTTLYLVTDSRTHGLALDIYKLSQHETQNFPFAIMSINITRIALQTLREEKLNKWVTSDARVMQKTENLVRKGSPTNGRLSTDPQPTVDRQLAEKHTTVGRQRAIWQTTDNIFSFGTELTFTFTHCINSVARQNTNQAKLVACIRLIAERGAQSTANKKSGIVGAVFSTRCYWDYFCS